MMAEATEENPRVLAATLAVGTEITDGQIVDRNSAWISDRLVRAGLEVVEHRAVADDRGAIERALGELASRVDYLFVTGGLGPTSDDFTRELIAKAFSKQLEFDPASWEHLSQLLLSRGVTVREIQRQQCFFPQGARVLTNPAGTANAFCLETAINGKTLRLFALPGPPGEIAAVWQAHLAAEIEMVIPVEQRERLAILRFLGRGESQIAEVVEEIIKGRGLRVGYRASQPYVEVKLWFRQPQSEVARAAISEIESALKAWLVGRDGRDLADDFLNWLAQSRERIKIIDAATGGLLHARLSEQIHARSQATDLAIETVFGEKADLPQNFSQALSLVFLITDARANVWRILFRSPKGHETVIEERPVFNYKVVSDRGRKYITERFFLRCLDLFSGRGASKT